MKLAYAAEIPFVKKTRGLSPEEYQQRIIAKLEPAFVFGGFILPWKGNHTYFRIYNLDTRKRLVRTVLIFTERSDQLSRATDRVPGLPASPGYVQ